MEQLRQIGEAMGSLKALMVFRDEIKINQRQCCLLADVYTLAFERITNEIKHNLKFEEKHAKWNALENPLRELHRIIREGEAYIKQCSEPSDWWAKAICMSQNIDCIEFHLHNLFWCIPIVKEDQWILSETISEKRSTVLMTKNENQLGDLLLAPKAKIFPCSLLVGSKDYQVKKRLRSGSGSQYKEIQWMGENFAVKHFFEDIEPLLPEIYLTSSVTHPNVLHYMYNFFDEDRKECFRLLEEWSTFTLGRFIMDT